MNVDTTKPHIGRIYDYVLGGHHNYEADRQAAESMMKLVPLYPKWARLNRWFLQFVGSKWAEDGYNRVLDLASGLPTQGHLNEWLPDARILFSDNDPLSVTYGEQILADKPDMKYVSVDLREPASLFKHAAEFFGDDRKLAVSFMGILYLLSDDEIRPIMQGLHAFCAPGSVMALTFAHLPDDPTGEALRAAAVGVQNLGRIQLHFRSPERMAELIHPWRIQVTREAETWLEVENTLVTREESERNPLKIFGAMAEH